MKKTIFPVVYSDEMQEVPVVVIELLPLSSMVKSALSPQKMPIVLPLVKVAPFSVSLFVPSNVAVGVSPSCKMSPL